MATTEQIPAAAVAPRDHMPLNGIDHVEMWVGNAAQAAYYFTRAFGFHETAYRGLETGARDSVSHVLEQGRVRLVVTGTLRSDTAIAAHHGRHGDGVKVIALSVPDVDEAYSEATARGAVGVAEPHWLEDDHGQVRVADIATYGDTVHRFVDRWGSGWVGQR
jgi:4-hydroxyphenylpyruvate dioxygenase